MNPNRAFIKPPANATREDVLGYGSNRHIAGLVVAPDYYWVYIGYGDAFDLDLEALGAFMDKPGGVAQASWYDPRAGIFQSLHGIILENQATFEPPTRGSVDNDWVL